MISTATGLVLCSTPPQVEQKPLPADPILLRRDRPVRHHRPAHVGGMMRKIDHGEAASVKRNKYTGASKLSKERAGRRTLPINKKQTRVHTDRCCAVETLGRPPTTHIPTQPNPNRRNAHQTSRSGWRGRCPSHLLQQSGRHVHDLPEVWTLGGVLLPTLDHQVAPGTPFI